MTRHGHADGPTRRLFLKAVGVAGVGAAAGGVAAGQETTPENGEDATTILLGAERNHWFGLAPEPIHEAENPTLTLAAGREYEIVWVNIDGHEHELIIEDADGEELVASDSNEAVGATASVTFTAGEEMAEYYCEYHPESMRGDVSLGEGFEAADETTPEETTPGKTTTEEEGGIY